MGVPARRAANLAPNLPGTELTEVVDGDGNYKGGSWPRWARCRCEFAGTARIVERDEAAHRIVLNAAGSEDRGKGQATMTLTATLAPRRAAARG